MKLAVLGAGGKTGVLLVEKALAAGYEVSALVRNADHALPSDTGRLTIIVGDATNQTDVDRLLDGCTAVLSTLGSNKLNSNLILLSTQVLMRSSQEANISRVIMLSSFLVAPSFRPGLVGQLVRSIMRKIITDKASGEELLKSSSLDWTIVYATPLDRSPPGLPVKIVTDTVSLQSGIARSDVAQFMLSALTDPQTIQRGLVITTK